MSADSKPTKYPLSTVPAAAEIKPGKFHRHFYGGVLGNALENDGEFSAQITDPQRGAGAGRGGGRLITMDGAICLAVFFRLMSGGLPSDRALKMARTFVFLGEAGNGLRAFNTRFMRPAGEVFSGNHDTFLVAITGSQDTNDSDGFAFVSGHDLAATSIMDWLHLNCEDSAPVCLVNLSEVIQEMREGLEGKGARGEAGATQFASQSTAVTSDPISGVSDRIHHGGRDRPDLHPGIPPGFRGLGFGLAVRGVAARRRWQRFHQPSSYRGTGSAWRPQGEVQRQYDVRRYSLAGYARRAGIPGWRIGRRLILPISFPVKS